MITSITRQASNRARIGEKYNFLTIIADTGEKYKIGAVKWLCQCDCGKTTFANVSWLRNGSKKSCGCYNKKALTQRRFSPGLATLNWLEKSYKTRAVKFNLEYDLTRENFINLIRENCYYCGSLPRPLNMYQSDKKKIRKSVKVTEETLFNSWLNANGIDRINSKLGYVLENCRTSCTMCNVMKNSHEEGVFIKHLKQILTNMENK